MKLHTQSSHLPPILKQTYNLKVAVILPTYNEAENVTTLIPAIQKSLAGFRVEIVVVDDDSEDGTAHVAEDLGATMIRRETKQGLGSAIRHGVQVALQRDADIIVHMDADWQHDPEDIPRILQPILDGRCSFTLGCRNISGSLGREGKGFFRGLVSQVAHLLADLLLGVHSSDPTSGFRAFDRLGATAVLATTQDSYPFQVEALRNLQAFHVPLEEVPIRFQTRLEGRSKLTLREALHFLEMSFIGFLRKRKQVR